MQPTTAYREDLQGLRAIAVTMVLLFHFELAGASGGFAGVDVFFVLSGFLMTKLLIARQDEPARTLIPTFLIKRFWRIGPAYFTTLIATLIAGWFVFLPLDYAKIAESALASSIFASNEYFKNQTGYFEDASVLKPLLHTWSLAVEMQFYLIWPIAYCLLRRFSFRVQGLLLIVTIVASYSVTAFFQVSKPELAFFSMPMRLWQFGFGALAANPWTLTQLKKLPLGSIAVQLIAVAAIVASTFLMSENLNWPTPWALFPTVATLVLIVAGQLLAENPGPIQRALSLPPLVWLGEISYSLYLVHWPIVCITYVIWWPAPSIGVRLAGLGLSVVLAWLMFRFLENPIRMRFNRSGSNSSSLVTALAAVLLVIFGSIYVLQTSGVPNRFPTSQQALLMNQTENHQPLPIAQDCLDGSKGCNANGKPTIFLWGDSHAETFRDGLALLAKQKGRNFSHQIVNACPPSPNIWSRLAHRDDGRGCRAGNQKAVQDLSKIENLEAVVLIGRWSYYTTTLGYSFSERDQRFVVNPDTENLTAARSTEVLKASLSSLLSDMQKRGVRVVLPMQVPEYRFDPSRCIKYATNAGASLNHCMIEKSQVDARQANYRKLFDELKADHKNLTLIETNQSFCADTFCSPLLNGVIAYHDDDHLLPRAAYKVLQQMPGLFN